MNDASQPPPLFSLPSFEHLMGPQSSTFWDAPFGQTTDPFAQDNALKTVSPTTTWSSPTLKLDEVSTNWYQQPQSNAADISRSTVLPSSLAQKRKSATLKDTPTLPNSTQQQQQSQLQQPMQGIQKQVNNPAADFTKRADWAHQVITELPDFYHVLSPSGYFLFASESIKDLAGYSSEDLVGRSITEILHPDDIDPFINTFNQCISTKTPLCIYARLRKKDSRHLVIEFTGHARYGDMASDSSQLSSLTGITTNSPSVAKCFFAMGRVYPGKNTAMLDTYLEHKIENERLKKKAKGLYEELGESDDNSPPNSAYFNGFDSNYIQPSMTTGIEGTDYSLYPRNLSSSAPSRSTHLHSHSDEKKKHKVRRGNNDHDYVCHDCGTNDSPEWRKGPLGPKTLCNACGLRWAKKAKAPKSGGGKR